MLCVAACLLAGGCFESDEERALAAYDRRDYAEAWHLAQTLADAGNPRGHELRALMAAQGLGTAIDFAGAFAAIDEAVAIDPSYAASRARLDDFVERTATRAQAAFDAAAWEHAMALAAPLEAFGHEAGAALANRLVTGGYVALPGSAMAWRAFWNDCAGNTRRNGADAGASVFAERCRGKTAVWDGTISARRGDTLLLRMRPGRPRARHDLALHLRRPADPTLAAVGGKVRFRGTVEARGDSQRPDVLADAEVLGPAALTPAERARALTLARAARRRAPAGGCSTTAFSALTHRHGRGRGARACRRRNATACGFTPSSPSIRLPPPTSATATAAGGPASSAAPRCRRRTRRSPRSASSSRCAGSSRRRTRCGAPTSPERSLSNASPNRAWGPEGGPAATARAGSRRAR